jgi:hypothetical protein
MKLHDQVKYWKEQSRLNAQALVEIRRYLNHSKFSQDISVNKNDILARITESNQSTINAQFEQYGEFKADIIEPYTVL